jgi:hypothetical protein
LQPFAGQDLIEKLELLARHEFIILQPTLPWMMAALLRYQGIHFLFR